MLLLQAKTLADKPPDPITPYGGACFFCHSHSKPPGLLRSISAVREQHKKGREISAAPIVAPHKVGPVRQSVFANKAKLAHAVQPDSRR
jgi:hypothetical protein